VARQLGRCVRNTACIRHSRRHAIAWTPGPTSIWLDWLVGTPTKAGRVLWYLDSSAHPVCAAGSLALSRSGRGN
jgi:hypothetical protein